MLTTWVGGGLPECVHVRAAIWHNHSMRKAVLPYFGSACMGCMAGLGQPQHQLSCAQVVFRCSFRSSAHPGLIPAAPEPVCAGDTYNAAEWKIVRPKPPRQLRRPCNDDNWACP